MDSILGGCAPAIAWSTHVEFMVPSPIFANPMTAALKTTMSTFPLKCSPRAPTIVDGEEEAVISAAIPTSFGVADEKWWVEVVVE